MSEYTSDEQKIAPKPITPGQYLILPRDTSDAAKGPGGMIPIPIHPPEYVTASDDDKKPVTLEAELGGHSRQIWQVKVVDAANHIYEINRADLVWSPPEYPPTLGITGEAKASEPVNCLTWSDGKKWPDVNPHKWKILPAPPQDPWLQQSMFAIYPMPSTGRLPQYFASCGSVPVKSKGEAAADSGSRSGMVLTKVGTGVQIQTWYFKPYSP